MKSLRLILVNPKFAGNVGSVARVAANFNIQDFIVVDPQCDVKSADAFLFATGSAKQVLENLRVADSIPQALEGCHTAIAIARRFGDLSPNTLPLLELPRWISEHQNSDSKIAILFGREDNCLSRKELMHCHYQVAIPTSDAMPTMNLSHAVAVVLFEIFSRSTQNENAEKNLATVAEFESFIDHWRQVINDSQAFVAGNSDHVLKRVTRALQKAHLNKQDIAAFRAVLSKVQVALGTRTRRKLKPEK